jgi:large subunit ribosomal protein L4
MAKAIHYSKEGKEIGKIDLTQAVFGKKVNDHLLYESIRAHLANQRQGTVKTKSRSEVSGGTSKPWRQKGTGRARAGSNTSSVWVRGNKSFGPRPRDYRTALPKKKKRGAFLCSLSAKAGENRVKVIDELRAESPKTRTVAVLVGAMQLDSDKNLFVVDQYDKNLFLSVRNLKNTDIRKVGSLNAFDVLNCANLIFTRSALESLEKKLK